MKKIEGEIRERLFGMRDEAYGDFQRKLVPTVAPELIIGVRVPELRKLAAELYGLPGTEEYLGLLPHRYYDENNLHALLIARIKDYEKSAAAVERFLPYVDNWATCDIMSPKAFASRPADLCARIERWIASGQTYSARFGMEMLMSHYLGDAFRPEQAELVAAAESEEYYVNMMRAWYFATALAKRWDDVIGYIGQKRLDKWTHNKTIQKAAESRRITEKQKAYLRTMKIV